jgi:hypothetical protein
MFCAGDLVGTISKHRLMAKADKNSLFMIHSYDFLVGNWSLKFTMLGLSARVMAYFTHSIGVSSHGTT